MTNAETTKKLLSEYLIARIPFISIHSIERDRVYDILHEIAVILDIPLYIQSLSKGIYDCQTKEIVSAEKTLFGALNSISELMRRKKCLTFLLTDIQNLSAENDVSHQLLDLVSLAQESEGTIITLTHSSVWPQLQRQGMLIHLDLPTEDEMIGIVQNCIRLYQSQISSEWNQEDIHEAAHYLTGVTKIEAINIISSLSAKKSILKSDLDYVREAKNNLFSNITGLEKIVLNKEFIAVGGLSGLQRWLDCKKILLQSENRMKMQECGIQPPRGILLVGVPGCGKSLSAKMIAKSWNLPLYRLDFATVQGRYVGQSEQQLRDALQTAENVSPCVLWIDEIEKGLAGFSSSNDNGITTRLVGQFLFWLQECKKQVFVVATANDVSLLPPELLRKGRFDEIFFVDLPTANERRDILKMYMARYLRLDFSGRFADTLVNITDGFSGADLEATIREIAYTKIAIPDFILDEESILEIFNHTIPLSKTSSEKVSEIRKWGEMHATPASLSQ